MGGTYLCTIFGFMCIRFDKHSFSFEEEVYHTQRNTTNTIFLGKYKIWRSFDSECHFMVGYTGGEQDIDKQVL